MKTEHKKRPDFSLLFILCAAAGGVAFALQDSILVKPALCLFFIVLNRITGLKINTCQTLVLLVFIVAVNLLNPAGEVLFQIGFFPVTGIPLEQGVKKASTLIGLFFISRYFLRGRINFSGSALLSRTFFYFRELSRIRLKPGRGFFRALDSLCLDVYGREPENLPAPDTPLREAVLNLAPALLCVSLYVLNALRLV